VAPWLERVSHPPPCDAIVTDIMMPGLTGMEILAGLAEVRRRPAVVVITAFGDERTHRRAKALGAICVLDKPFDVDDLRTILLNLTPRATDGGY
jgi:CheY-like chemotaxis protein